MLILREKGRIRQTKTLQEWGVQIPLMDWIGYDVLGYNFCFETEKEYCNIGIINAVEPIGPNRLKKELRKYIDEDLLGLKPEDVYNCVLIASDGDCIEIYDIDPSAIFPLTSPRKKYSKLYVDKGGEN